MSTEQPRKRTFITLEVEISVDREEAQKIYGYYPEDLDPVRIAKQLEATVREHEVWDDMIQDEVLHILSTEVVRVNVVSQGMGDIKYLRRREWEEMQGRPFPK
jgi:hypothetical protein